MDKVQFQDGQNYNIAKLATNKKIIIIKIIFFELNIKTQINNLILLKNITR